MPSLSLRGFSPRRPQDSREIQLRGRIQQEEHQVVLRQPIQRQGRQQGLLGDQGRKIWGFYSPAQIYSFYVNLGRFGL